MRKRTHARTHVPSRSKRCVIIVLSSFIFICCYKNKPLSFFRLWKKCFLLFCSHHCEIKSEKKSPLFFLLLHNLLLALSLSRVQQPFQDLEARLKFPRIYYPVSQCFGSLGGKTREYLMCGQFLFSRLQFVFAAVCMGEATTSLATFLIPRAAREAKTSLEKKKKRMSEKNWIEWEKFNRKMYLAQK